MEIRLTNLCSRSIGRIPIYDVRKGLINQAEALLRWNHPQFGRVLPVEFISIAEKSKLILPITDWVITQSRLKLAEWKASGIKLEVTESTLMRDADEIIKVFYDLKKIGVKLAMDDFGTGYSSLGYMRELPPDIIKPDRSLISNILVYEKEQMIVSSMITIIHR